MLMHGAIDEVARLMARQLDPSLAIDESAGRCANCRLFKGVTSPKMMPLLSPNATAAAMPNVK